MDDNNFIQRINIVFSKFAEWVLGHRLLVSMACLFLCAGSFILIPKLHFDFHPKAWVVEDDSSFNYYFNIFMEEFGGDEYLYLMYKANKGLFNLDILNKTKALTADLRTIPHIKKVNSLTNIEFLEGRNDTLKVINLRDEFPKNQKEADYIKHKFLDKLMFRNFYLSEDGKYGAFLCEIEKESEDNLNYQREIGTNLKRVLSKPDYEDFVFYPVGNAMVAIATWDLIEKNTVVSSSIAFIMIAIVLAFLLRQFKSAIGPFVIVSMALLLILSFMATFKFPITTLFGLIPSMLMAIGIASAVHLVAEYQIHLKAGHDNRRAIIGAAELLGFPCLFTSLTTAAGFLSLTTSKINPIRHAGLAVAFGVLTTFVLTFTLLLVILSMAGPETEAKFRKSKKNNSHGLIDVVLLRIANLNEAHFKKIIILFTLLSILLVYGITKVEVNTNILLAFGDRVKVFHDFMFVDKIMGGTNNFEVLLESKKADGIKNIRFLKTLEKIQQFADKQDYVVKKTVSIVDLTKDINCSLHNNDKAYYKLPSSDNEISQSILLYEFYGGDKIGMFVSPELSSARLTVYVQTADSKIYKKFYDALLSYIESVKPENYTFKITGSSYLAIKMFDNMTEFMSKSILLAIAVISVMMIFVFRSIKIGLISMIPNFFPIIFGLGFMGMSGIPLSQFTSISGCIIIGLAVDDTIHFMSRYRMEFYRLRNYSKALEATMTGVGRALTITTVILLMGFGSCMTSELASMSEMSLLCCVCFLFALLADFFIAPSLIFLFKPFGKE